MSKNNVNSDALDLSHLESDGTTTLKGWFIMRITGVKGKFSSKQDKTTGKYSRYLAVSGELTGPANPDSYEGKNPAGIKQRFTCMVEGGGSTMPTGFKYLKGIVDYTPTVDDFSDEGTDVVALIGKDIAVKINTKMEADEERPDVKMETSEIVKIASV